jgi:hypothetical protein
VTDALILAAPEQLPDGPVWGTDGMARAPGGDDALDWVTLVRLLGWRAAALDRNGRAVGDGHGVIVVCGAPDRLPEELFAEVSRRLHRRATLVIAGVGAARRPWHTLAGVARRAGRAELGRSYGRLRWHGPGPSVTWTLQEGCAPLPLECEPGVEVWASLDDVPVVTVRRLQRGSVVASLAFELVDSRAMPGAVMALLKQVLTCGSPFPTAWLDLAGAVVLRMDDPGASANVHLRSWSYAKLGQRDWTDLGDALSVRGARMSVGYTPGWMDDGDRERGSLQVAGMRVERTPGAVHPSPLVVHTDHRGNAPGRVNDYEAEFRGIRTLQEAGLVGVELHGHTHMHPDGERWSRAPDRYDEVGWFWEFTPESDDFHALRPLTQHPVQLGIALVAEHFGARPTTLICPGQRWTPAALARALDAGLELVSADGLALRHDGRFCWCAAVRAVYIDKPEPLHLVSGLPTIGYFHDYELAAFGIEWLTRHLDAWRRAGARRFIDFRELAAALALTPRIGAAANGEWMMTLSDCRVPQLPRPLPVLIHAPGGDVPAHMAIDRGQQRTGVAVQRLGDGLGRLVLPPG